MKKIFMPFIMALLLTAFAGCADNSDGTTGDSGNTPSYDIGNIPVDDTVVEFAKGGSPQLQTSINIKNPRTEAEEYYPILISSAMDLNGEADLSKYGLGIIKGIGYRSYFGDKEMRYDSNSGIVNSNLNFPVSGEEMYNLKGAKSLNASASGTYYILLDTWNAEIPADGIFIIAFLTEIEAAKYIPDNSNIKFLPDNPTGAAGFKPTYLDSKTVDELNNLGALRQYKFTVK